MQNLYITCTLLSTIMSLGDFNSIYLLTGAGPADATQTLATLGIRYAFGMPEIEPGVSPVVVALPVLLPLLILMLRRMRRGVGASAGCRQTARWRCSPSLLPHGPPHRAFSSR